MKKLFPLILFCMLFLSVSPAFAEQSDLASLRIESTVAELHPGTTGQLTVSLFDEDGNPFMEPADITYTSINPYAASVDSTGEVTANHVGTTKIIVTAQSGIKTVSNSIALHVADPASGVLTFENTPNGQLPPGVSTSTPSLSYVTDERGDASRRSALIWDTSTTALADLKYGTSSSQTKTLEFSVYPVGSYAALQILNGSNSAADTAFWIGFASNGLLYYDGTKYVNITNTNVLTKNQWNKVHIEITNTDKTSGKADIYVNGALKGTAYKTAGSYGSNTAAGINAVRFMSSGTAPVTDKFYIDNLSLVDGIVPVEEEPLTIDLGAPYSIADNSADESEYAHIPFTYANPDASRVYVNYSRHEDTYLSHPIDSTKISADGAATFPTTIDNPDMFIMTMAQLPDGRTFAKNYMNYYLTDTTAATTSWIIDNDVWQRVDGVLTMPAAEVEEVDGPLVGSVDWYPMVFSKGIVVLDDGTILNTLYGFGKAYLVQSSDNGQTWTYRSTIAANDGTLFHTDGSEIYFAEPSLQLAADGSLLSIMRTVSNMPLYQTRSYDQGLTWSKPELLPGIDPSLARSIYPQTLLLDNGVLVLTTGRPNNKLLFSLDGSGYKWEYAVTTVAPAPPATTTGNTSISRIGVNKILQVGDHGFIHNAPAGIWGVTAELTRIVHPNPVIESARLKTEKDIMALQSLYALTLDAAFDTNSNIIDKNDTTVTYYSETPEYAEIDSETGTITPKAEGKATFIASVEHEGVTIISNTVTIRIADEEKLYKFETAIDEFALEPGQLASISNMSYNRLGDDLNGVSYSYVSSDSSVAAVDAVGSVTAVGPGTAAISVTAQKGDVSLTKSNSVIVKHPVWLYDSFDQDNALPPGFAKSNSIGVISQAQAYSGSNSLYIKDDSASALAGVTRAFEPAKAAVIEFMLYPERADNSIAIAVGAGGSSTANEAVILGFSKPVEGSNTLKVLGYDGLATGIISNSSGVVFNEWSKIRIEVSADSPGKLYVNDQFIVSIPLSAAKNTLDRVRFSSGGTALVGDYYFIDDVKIMYFGDVSELDLSDMKLEGVPASLQVNETAQSVSTAVYSNGAIIADVSGQASYSSSNEHVAAVSESGLITALSEGTTVISVVYGGREASASLKVTAAPAAVIHVEPLADIKVRPGTERTALSLPDQLEIMLSDGSTRLANVAWNDGNPHYDPNAAGGYEFTGLLELPGYVTNPEGKLARVFVIVEPAAETSLDSMEALLERYIDSGDIRGPLLAQLSNSLKQARHHADKGSAKQAAKHLSNFLKHLNNGPMQQHVSAEAKAMLNADAEYLIERWL